MSQSREVFAFNPGWSFHPGDIPFPEVIGHGVTYASAKAGSAGAAASPDWDDTAWPVVDLPHDWAVAGDFDPSANVSQGYRRRGIAWYRKRFALPESDIGRHLELEFGAIASHATVWINGTVVHRNWCGYTGFTIDLTPLARFGAEVNCIAIRVDAEQQEGWWYEGAGIYRDVTLVKRSPVHIVTDGVFAQPVPLVVAGQSGSKSAKQWTIPVELTLFNSGTQPRAVHVQSTLFDPEGRELGAASAGLDATIPVLEDHTLRFDIALGATPVRLWNLESPNLYRLRTTLSVAEGDSQSELLVVDSVDTTCGFRTIRFDPDWGFFLNDRPVKLKGTCNHQDHAGVGVAVPASLWDWRIRRLKELGSNAYRCAHNPPDRALLDACDRHGMLVMDENRHFNASPEYLAQLEWLVRRDRNHPSVILWSVFNEEPQQGSRNGYEMVRRMAALVKRLDPSRPVTAAMNGGLDAPINVSQAVDVVGFNYQPHFYDWFHEQNPGIPCTSSEDTSAYMTRGEWLTDPATNRMGSYDDNAAAWGATHRDAWNAIAERPFLAGGFVWTGFDYRGEPTPHVWPSAGSFFGIMDQCGLPKAAFWIHQAQWLDPDTQTMVRILTPWTWDCPAGTPLKVMVASNAPAVELFLNNRSLGVQKGDRRRMNTWEVPWEPGTLTALATCGGTCAHPELARHTVETTGAPACLALYPDRDWLLGDGTDAQVVNIAVLDSAGRVVEWANPRITLKIDGPARLLGMGNGDPNCHEAEQTPSHSLFHGWGQAIIRSTGPANSADHSITIRAESPGLAPAMAALHTRPASLPLSIPAAPPAMALWNWRMSPISTERPDPLQEVLDNDMNTWSSVWPGYPQEYHSGTWAIYRSTATLWDALNRSGGTLLFSNFYGQSAQVWVDGKQSTCTINPDGSLTASFEPGSNPRTINLLVQVAGPGGKGGLGGRVTAQGK